MLECILIDSNPNKGIVWKWFKVANSSYELSNKSSYIIPKTNKEDTGTYNCTADNSIGTSIAATVYLDVQCKYLF